MYLDICRLLVRRGGGDEQDQKLQPAVKAFILENVPGLQNANDGKDFKKILEAFSCNGLYHVTAKVVDAKHVTAQRRRRLYFVGVATGHQGECRCFQTARPQASVEPIHLINLDRNRVPIDGHISFGIHMIASNTNEIRYPPKILRRPSVSRTSKGFSRKKRTARRGAEQVRSGAEQVHLPTSCS